MEGAPAQGAFTERNQTEENFVYQKEKSWNIARKKGKSWIGKKKNYDKPHFRIKTWIDISREEYAAMKQLTWAQRMEPIFEESIA